MPARRLPGRAFVVGILFIAGAGIAFHLRPARQAPGPSHRSPEFDTPVGNRTLSTTEAPAPGFQSSAIDAALAEALAQLRHAGGSDAAARAAIDALFHELDTGPADARRAALIAFFRSGQDAATGLPYGVGPGGGLRSWPTLRVAVLDHAGRLDPDTIQALAELVLVEPGSPDEWSVALRNLARTSPDGPPPALLTDSTHRLLANEAWAAAPSIGYLEAFDLLVHARLLDELGRLESLMATSRPREVRFAAFLAGDRLALVEPRTTLALLAGDPALLESVPAVRAGMFARADVRDAGQREALETYLARSDLTEAERADFGALFPNHNTTFAHHLVTAADSLSRGEMIARDRAALATVRTWRLDPRFGPWSAALASCADRLETQLAHVH